MRNGLGDAISARIGTVTLLASLMANVFKNPSPPTGTHAGSTAVHHWSPARF